MVNKKIIAIIPARGGSKRIPFKNIINFNGKPLIAWTIEAAIQTNLFDKIVVSTDSEKIANIAKQYNAEVPFLRDKHCDDHSTISQATIYSLAKIEEVTNEAFDIVVQLMPNCPLRNSDDIQRSLQNFVTKQANFQISCFKFGWMNPWWGFKLSQNGKANYIFPEALKKRSQDLEKLYCPTGAIWIAKTKNLIQNNSFYSDKTIFFPLNWQNSLDIDNYGDLEMANVAFKTFKFKQQSF